MTLSVKAIDDLFSNIGIDSIGFYAPKFYLNLENLAKMRDVNPNKYKYGLMASEMRIPDRGEDCISIGLKAAKNALIRGKLNPSDIDAVFVGTEASIYAVKSISNIFKDLLGISKNCYTQDVSNACAAGTLAIINAIGMIETGIINKALIITVDISKYDLKSPGEPTQGAGAVALVISKNPKIAVFSKNFGKVSANVNDFFRPEGEKNAQVFGQYSVNSYLNLQLEAFDDLISQTGNIYSDYYIFHSPYAKLPLKFMQKLIAKRALKTIDLLMHHDNKGNYDFQEIPHFNSLTRTQLLSEEILEKIEELNVGEIKKQQIKKWIVEKIRNTCLPPLQISALFGNMYSASIWAELQYILENQAKPNETIYFGSYGSGATAISGLLKIQPKFHHNLIDSFCIKNFIHNKEQISVEEYEDLRTHSEQIDLMWAKIEPLETKLPLDFQLNYCSEGCNLTQHSKLGYCPKGHEGNHKITFPMIGTVIATKKFNEGDLTPFTMGYFLMEKKQSSTSLVEFELKRWKNPLESNPKHGLLNWIPIYRPIINSPYLDLCIKTLQTGTLELGAISIASESNL